MLEAWLISLQCGLAVILNSDVVFRDGEFEMVTHAKLGRQIAILLYVVAMAAVIVGLDFAFFRNQFWLRLTVNIGVVSVFAAFYLRFLRRS